MYRIVCLIDGTYAIVHTPTGQLELEGTYAECLFFLPGLIHVKE